MKRPTKILALVVAGLIAAPVMTALPASAAGTLPQSVEDALTAALMDEYHAEAFYDAVIAKFGATRPFSNVIRSEQMHANAIADLMRNYGMSVPQNAQLGSAEIAAAVPATLSAACSIGVQAEIDNAGLYEGKLLPAVDDYPDIATTFQVLRDASQNMHLTAFERCAA
jgi:hypothetical protein